MSGTFNLIKDFMSALNASEQNKTQPYDTQGTVKRVEGDTAWVQFTGSDRETPIQMTIACDVGDTVQARIGGGSAWLTGNLTAPPTDDKKANQAISMVTTVVQEVQEQVEEALEDVSTVDDVTMQYCLSDSSSSFVQYGDWSNTPPTYVSGKYYWTRSVLVDDDGNETYGEPRYSQDTQLSVETDVAFKSNNNHFWHDTSGAYVTTTNKSYSTGSAVRITASGILQQVNGSTVSSWTNDGISFLQGGSTVASFGSGGVNLYGGSGQSGPQVSLVSDTLSFKTNSTTTLATIQCQEILSGGRYFMNFQSSVPNGGYGYLQIVPDSTYCETSLYACKGSGRGAWLSIHGDSASNYVAFRDVNKVVSEGPIYIGNVINYHYKLLTTGTATSGSLTIASGETCSLTTTSASKTGYTPIGVVGYDIDGSGMSNINVFKMYISGSNVAFRLRNNYTSSWTGTITFYVLYIASSQGV